MPKPDEAAAVRAAARHRRATSDDDIAGGEQVRYRQPASLLNALAGLGTAGGTFWGGWRLCGPQAGLVGMTGTCSG